MNKTTSNIKFHLLILFIVVILLQAPFLNQAFHIDDESFLSNNGLYSVYYWVLLPVSHASNFSEIALHSFYIIFVIAAIFLMYFLASIFTKNAFFPAVILAVTPAFLLSAHTIMADIPFLVFYLSSIVVFIFSFRREKPSYIVLSLIFALVGCMIKRVGIVTFVILWVFYLVYCQKMRFSKFRFVFYFGLILIPSALYFLYLVYPYISANQMNNFKLLGFFEHYSSLSRGLYLFKAMALINFIGGVIIFPFSLFFPFLKGKANRGILLASVLLSCPISYTARFLLSYSALQASAVFLFSCAGIFMLFICCNELTIFLKNRLNKEEAFLSAWVLFIFVFDIIFALPSARYILFAAPPLILLFCKKVETVFTESYKKIVFYLITFILTISISVPVSIADYELAGSYRYFADRISGNYKRGHENMWFIGHWGFDYYMRKAGCLPLEEGANLYSKNLQKGDIVIIAMLPWPLFESQDFVSRLKLIDVVMFPGKIPIRTVSSKGKAYFYSYMNYPFDIGFLPYSFSREPLDMFMIYEVIL